MVKSIDCLEERAEEKNSAGSRVFVMDHDTCPGELFSPKPSDCFLPMSNVTVEQQYFHH